MKIFLFLLIFYPIICTGQYNYKEEQMSKKTKQTYSMVWKTVGISSLFTGLYLANTKQNPQRIDIPLIVFGVVFTVEGIRLKQQIKL